MVGGYGDSHFAFVYIGLWEFGVVYTGAVWTTGVECSHGHCVQWMRISGHGPIITSIHRKYVLFQITVSMAVNPPSTRAEITVCVPIQVLYKIYRLHTGNNNCNCTFFVWLFLYLPQPTQSWYHHGHPRVCGSGSHYPSFHTSSDSLPEENQPLMSKAETTRQWWPIVAKYLI